MDDLDVLEIDSPLEQAVDAEDDEIDEIVLGQDGGANEDRTNANGLAGRANIGTDKPIHYLAKPKDRKTLLHYPDSLPYECESLEEFDRRLDWICRHLVASIEANDYDYGFLQWNHYLQCLLTLKYPIQLPTLARLARLFYHVSLRPGLHPMTSEMAANTCMTLLGGRKKITIAHLVLPWRPLYETLRRSLYSKDRRAVAPTGNVATLMDLASYAQRFFDPDEAEDMMREMLPDLDGSSINSVIATLALLVHFLPTTHPQQWLPTLFRLWESFSSSLYDDQMLELCARLAEQHGEDPRISSEKSREETGIHADHRDDSQDQKRSRGRATTSEQGLWNDVGIFTEHQFAFILTKCLRSAGLPVGSSKAANAALMAQSSSLRTGADSTASSSVLNMRKPSELSHSFATIIVYSMMHDSPYSTAPTPSGSATPTEQEATVQLSASSQTPHLAGSKALGALARHIQATESYFHPSNWGVWAQILSSLVKNLTWQFAKRWQEEEKPDCKTPKAYRLTKDIKREFCATLRTVCLLSLFSKDPVTIAASQASMKRLALLEPELILPPVLDRAYLSLEALETTQRTMSIITALSTLTIPLISRDIYRPGGKHLVPLLHLCIPGIDLNDSMKTVATSILIVVACSMIKIDDLTRPEIAAIASNAAHNEDGMPVEEDEEDEALRLSTAGFEDWAVSFFRRVLALFDALPEEGKGGRAGGRLEEQVTSTLLAACDAVCCAMSDHMFDITFKIVADYCFSTVSAQAVRVSGALVSCFARHNPHKVLHRLLRPCAQAIRLELQQGASSVRTTSTSQPLASDTALHWYLSILTGSLTFSGQEILAYREEMLDLMTLLCEQTKSERGYGHAATLIQRVLLLLVSIYPNEQRFVNPDEWASDEMQSSSHKYWGKMYAVKDVKIQWHMPTDEELAFAIEILDKVVSPRLDTLERLVQPDAVRDKVWSNDFCRNMVVARLAFAATNSVILEYERGGGKTLDDVVAEGYDEFKAVPKPFESGFLLKDENDPRYRKVKTFKQRFGQLLHLAAQSSHDSDSEDQIDCVKLMLRSIRTFMTSYGYNADDHKSYSRSVGFHQSMSLLFPRQKKYPRLFWIRRAAHHHSSRGRLNSFYRIRTQLDDQLTHDVTELAMSNYTAIRKTAQNALQTIMAHYEGTRAMIMNTLLTTVRDSTNDDRVKGALYVLGSKTMFALSTRNPYFTEEYFVYLLNAQHRSKPSIQKLLRGIINDASMRIFEPCTLVDEIQTPGLTQACAVLIANADAEADRPSEKELTGVRQQRAMHVQKTEEFWPSLTDRVLAYVQDPSTHWSFAIFGARLLRTLIRRDKPLRADVASYFTQQLISENPTMRRLSQAALTKILLYVKVQTMCKTPAEVVSCIGNIANHPLKRQEPMPKVTEEWKIARLNSFAQKPTGESKLFDKDAPGWLAWSDKQTYYIQAPETGVLFDWAGKDALAAIEAVLKPDHWREMLRHFSQEKERTSLSNETTVLIKSIFQVFGTSQLNSVKEHVEDYVQMRDRHKHRAAAEVLAGIQRGSKHWVQADLRSLWSWLDSILPKILAECTPDSHPAWQQSIEYMLQQRDPRRALPLVATIVKAANDSFSSSQSPWEQAKAHTMLRGVLLSLELKFYAWTPELLALYGQHLETDFNEVRTLIASNVTDMDLLKAAPSFASADELMARCGAPDASGEYVTGSIFAPRDLEQVYSAQLRQAADTLAALRAERVPKSQGTSRYDLLASTTLIWLAEMLRDHRRNAMTLCAIEFIPTIFECCNLNDNAELSSRARSVLLAAVSTTAYFDVKYVKRIIRKVLDVIEGSQDSWRARLDALPVLQILYFQNLFYLDAELVNDIVKVLIQLFSDPHLEVRSVASVTLSGIVRCSERKMIQDLRQQFTQHVLQHGDRLPKRGTAQFNERLIQLHAGILGAVALISAFPYSVPAWMPALICDTVARFQDAPDPVGPACKKLAADFKRTHQDTWEEDKEQFSTEQLAEYYEWGGRTDYYA